MSILSKKLRSEAYDENGYGHPLTTLLLAAADEIERLEGKRIDAGAAMFEASVRSLDPIQ